MKNNKFTPLNKLLKNLSFLNSSSSFKRPIVLVLDGSMNPIHKSHIQNFEIAKKEIERKNSNVEIVAGYISPSTDIYVRQKLGNEAISGKHRIEMIRLAIEDSSWIEVDEQGINFSTGDPLEKMNYLLNYLNSSQEVLKYCNGVKLIYLCGSDLVKESWKNGWKTFPKLIENGYDAVVIGREKVNVGWKDECKKYLDLTFEGKNWDKFIFFADKPMNNEISSTKIRNIISGKEEGNLEDLLSFRVLEYIRENKLLHNDEKKNVSKITKPMLILVAGGTASGKTALVRRIKKEIDKVSIGIGTDDYITVKVKDKETGKEIVVGINFNQEDEKLFDKSVDLWIKEEYEWCSPKNVDWEALINKIKWELSNFDSNKIIIIEGLNALQKEELRNMADLKIYSDVEDDLRLIAKITRSPYYKKIVNEPIKDNRNFGGTVTPFPFAFESWINGTKPGEKKYVLPTKQYADLIFPVSDWEKYWEEEFDKNIEEICNFINLYFIDKEEFETKKQLAREIRYGIEFGSTSDDFLRSQVKTSNQLKAENSSLQVLFEKELQYDLKSLKEEKEWLQKELKKINEKSTKISEKKKVIGFFQKNKSVNEIEETDSFRNMMESRCVILQKQIEEKEIKLKQLLLGKLENRVEQQVYRN